MSSSHSVSHFPFAVEANIHCRMSIRDSGRQFEHVSLQSPLSRSDPNDIRFNEIK